METIQSNGARLLHQLEGVDAEYSQAKTSVGLCQHPCHDSMPYAPMLKLIPKERQHTFSDRSSVTRGTTVSRKQLRKKDQHAVHALRLEEVGRGDAVSHCGNCHILYTVCEDALFGWETGFAKQEFEDLRRLCPNFVEHYLGQPEVQQFDFAAYKEQLCQKISEGVKKAYKRKAAGSVNYSCQLAQLRSAD